MTPAENRVEPTTRPPDDHSTASPGTESAEPAEPPKSSESSESAGPARPARPANASEPVGAVGFATASGPATVTGSAGPAITPGPAGPAGPAGSSESAGPATAPEAAIGRPPHPPITLLIADDHPVVRDGLSGMFSSDPGFHVLGEAADGAEAIGLAQSLDPDVILMDLRMPGMDGVTAIAELARRGVRARVLVLTVYDTDSYVLPAIGAGATGYLLKDAPRAELFRAVRAAAHGQAVLSPTVATRLLSRFRAVEPGPLSPRELEVLELVAAGNTNREAAGRLFLSEATVKAHLLNIYAKLGVSDRAAAVAEAFNRKLLMPRTTDNE